METISQRVFTNMVTCLQDLDLKKITSSKIFLGKMAKKEVIKKTLVQQIMALVPKYENKYKLPECLSQILDPFHLIFPGPRRREHTLRFANLAIPSTIELLIRFC